MEYKRVPKTNWDVSQLSFGCMRFKDEETAVKAVRKAVELGVNYFDVAPVYGEGTAEVYLGKAIRGIRDKIIVTAKSSTGNGGNDLSEYNPEAGFGIRTADQARRQIERSMKILGVDHLDMYQFWALHTDGIFQEGIKPGGFLEGVLKAKEEGLFDYIGMTTHSKSDDIIRYLKNSPYEFDMVTLPFSPIDPSRTKAIEYCARRGIGVVAMNPLGGGRLAHSVAALDRLALRVGCGSMVEAALRFVAGQPGITTALNGITLSEHAIQGAEFVGKGPLPADANKELVSGLSDLYANVKHFCTGCRYCGECPEGILIPEVLEIYTCLQVPSLAAAAKADIAKRSQDGYDPAVCSACKQCEEKCPNKLPVSELMAAATAEWCCAPNN